jgi:DNA-binding NtrC family response regulator
MIPAMTREKFCDSRGVIPTRVLVVDEEALVRWSLCTALAAAGFDAVAAETIQDAQRLVSEWPPPRVAIIDSHAGGAGDRALIRTIRDVYSDCRFVILTTTRRGDVDDPGGASAVAVVEKPFDLSKVVRVVADLARKG